MTARRGRHLLWIVALLGVLALTTLAPPAFAAFPYTRPAGWRSGSGRTLFRGAPRMLVTFDVYSTHKVMSVG